MTKITFLIGLTVVCLSPPAQWHITIPAVTQKSSTPGATSLIMRDETMKLDKVEFLQYDWSLGKDVRKRANQFLPNFGSHHNNHFQKLAPTET